MSNIDNDENVLAKARKIQENRDKIEKEKKLRERKAIKDRVHKLQQETQERKQKKDVLIKENLIKSKEEFKRIEPSINILRESIASLKKDMDEINVKIQTKYLEMSEILKNVRQSCVCNMVKCKSPYVCDFITRIPDGQSDKMLQCNYCLNQFNCYCDSCDSSPIW